MFRIFVVLSVIAVSAAAIPKLYQADPAAFHRFLSWSGKEDARKTSMGVEQSRETVSDKDTKRPINPLSGRQVRLQMSSSGHFVANFKLNGRVVKALVDTGATQVAINEKTARRIGIFVSPSDFKYVARTANGMTRFASAKIDQVRIGRIEVNNVGAAVLADNSLDGVLIGMTFLNRLSRFHVEEGELVLQQ